MIHHLCCCVSQSKTNTVTTALSCCRLTDTQTQSSLPLGTKGERWVSLINPTSVNPITHSLKGLLKHNCPAIYIQVNVAPR